MQIRPVQEEEKTRFATIQGDAFVADQDAIDRWLARLDFANTRALVDEVGDIKAALNMIFTDLWLGRTTVRMVGFASVATPPEYRRQNMVKQLFLPVLDEVYAKGYNIATLYPFRYPFYRKFGFERVSVSKRMVVKIDQFNKFKPKTAGRWKPATVDQWSEFNRIYETFYEGRFGGLRRVENWWRNYKLTQSSGKPYKLYLWYDEQGQAQAYTVYSISGDEKEREMNVALFWTSPAARHEVFAFVANHDSQVQKVSFTAATSDDYITLFDESDQIEERLESGYMLRILDAAKAMQERSWPLDITGTFSLALHDDLYERNNLAVQIEIADGKAQATPLTDKTQAGLACDIRQLAQLYAGFLSPMQLVGLGLLEVRDEKQLAFAQAVFSPSGQAASLMLDYF